MASPTKIQFIEQALSSDSPFNLSYLDPNQKWVIRNHLLSFLQDFPNFTPNFGTFVHNDGMAVNLLCVTGELRISATPNTPLVPITIWLHENHPFMAPIVFVSPNYNDRIRSDHPFVYLSGSTTCPYLQTWAHPRSSLPVLVRNLTRLFTHDHPLTHSQATVQTTGSGSGGISSGFAHPSRVSKREALDRLAGAAYYDVANFKAGAQREIEELRKLRAEMRKRVEFGERMIGGLETEKEELKNRGSEMAEQADVVRNWLRFNDREELVAAIGGDEIEKAFEIVECESVLECLAGDTAIEDTIYAMDKGIEMGLMSFESYVKQIRSLAREQFYKRAFLLKFRDSNVLR